jgi:hypothetical protein
LIYVNPINELGLLFVSRLGFKYLSCAGLSLPVAMEPIETSPKCKPTHLALQAGYSKYLKYLKDLK